MKRLFVFFVAASFVACNTPEDAKVKGTNADSTSADVALPYTATYSSKFEIGSQANVKTVLELMKDWDNNDMDNARKKFADSVMLLTSDGSIMSGPADTIVNATKPYRNSLGTVSSRLDAVVPLRSTDKNEDWVLLWFTEHRTDASGKKDSVELQETWRLNKDGKADLLYQYQRNKPAAKK